MGSTTTPPPPTPIPDFNFTIDPRLEPYNKPARQWLTDNAKTWAGLVTGALVFNPSNHVLLVQRASHDSMPDLWETPGGACDWEDPSLLIACARELWEEAGLVAERMTHAVTEGAGKGDGDICGGSVFTNRYGTVVFCRFTFAVEVRDWKEVKLDPEEHQDFLWVSEEEVRSGFVGERKVQVTTGQMKNILLEGFRLRRENGFSSEASAMGGG